MNDFDIREILCEILGGLLLILIVVSVLHVFGVVDLKALLGGVASKLDAGTITSILFVSYVIGLLVDSIGLAVGEIWFDDKLLSPVDIPIPDTKKFWTTAPEHVVTYRDHQWMYYSAYRNVLILLVPGSLLFSIVIYQFLGPRWALGVFVAIAGLMWTLWRSAKCLLGIYRKIPSHFANG